MTTIRFIILIMGLFLFTAQSSMKLPPHEIGNLNFKTAPDAISLSLEWHFSKTHIEIKRAHSSKLHIVCSYNMSFEGFETYIYTTYLGEYHLQYNQKTKRYERIKRYSFEGDSYTWDITTQLK